jgi:hypothetical protein
MVRGVCIDSGVGNAERCRTLRVHRKLREFAMSLSKVVTVTLVSLALGSTSAAAQLKPPEHWLVALDNTGPVTPSETASDSTVWFVSMAPGWHVTTGPAAIMFDGRRIADGRYDVEFEFHLFPQSSNNEAGVFIGGALPRGPERMYTAFVIRADGAVAVIRRVGALHGLPVRETFLHPWTPMSAVAKPVGDETGRNTLRVAMDSAGVHFSVNGTPVRSWKHGELQLTGAYGIRMGRNVNVHVTRLDVLQRLAPIPAGK